MAIAPVLKTGVRKDFWVRVPGPPLHQLRPGSPRLHHPSDLPPLLHSRLRGGSRARLGPPPIRRERVDRGAPDRRVGQAAREAGAVGGGRRACHGAAGGRAAIPAKRTHLAVRLRKPDARAWRAPGRVATGPEPGRQRLIACCRLASRQPLAGTVAYWLSFKDMAARPPVLQERWPRG